VNGQPFESREYTVAATNLPDFLFVLYQLLASNLLYLALFILALAAVVAFLPQRRAARARRAMARPSTVYPPNYYVQAAKPSQPPPAQQGPAIAPQVETRVATPAWQPPAQAPPATQPAPITQTAIPAKKRCPNCGTMVNVDNLFCFFCGNPFR
jgi:hypothetical protein